MEDTYITYDENAMRSKEAYEKSTEAVLRAKFDHVFDYSSGVMTEEEWKAILIRLRNNYLKEKEYCDELYMQWKTSDPNHPRLKEDCAKLIAAIKEKKDNRQIHNELNDVLDKLHEIEYTTQYHEVVRTPIYDLEIRTLDAPHKQTSIP